MFGLQWSLNFVRPDMYFLHAYKTLVHTTKANETGTTVKDVMKICILTHYSPLKCTRASVTKMDVSLLVLCLRNSMDHIATYIHYIHR